MTEHETVLDYGESRVAIMEQIEEVIAEHSLEACYDVAELDHITDNIIDEAAVQGIQYNWQGVRDALEEIRATLFA